MPGRGRVAEMKGRGTAGSDQGAGKEDRPAQASDNNIDKSNNPPQVCIKCFDKNICRKYIATFAPWLLSVCH